jgi:recombination protein RecR
LHLIRHREQLMRPLSHILEHTADALRDCTVCGNIDTQTPCAICAHPNRDRRVLCVVEDLADLWAIERGGHFRGLYHVLGGTLSALEGRGPEALSIQALVRRASSPDVQEVILATNATVEGQTTAYYLADQLQQAGVRITRLAQGIPLGGELDYLDEGTLGAAMHARLAVA